ncbi:MAG: sodium-dependent transporter [Calditrichia bacterium]
MEKREQFSSRWALLLATVGMAIGAGNIWRFPRLAGQYGGAFLIPWLIFLFLWSVPLLVVEFAIGRKTRRGVMASFGELGGSKVVWMGGFVTLCTTAIMFYYSVVTGWALRYFLVSVSGRLTAVNHSLFWQDFISGYQPLLFHLVALVLGSWIIYQGVVRGIERANKILLPSLLLLLLIGVVRSLTLPNAAVGLEYFFGIKTQYLFDYRVWLEALSQSAWSTGAGWGLVLTYSVYMKKKEDVVLNAFITGFGNNSASIIAGLAIIPAIFSLTASIPEAEAALKAGNDGLSFIVIPQLFSQLPFSRLFTSVFFLALFFAALSSLISMLELATRSLMDFGLKRKKALPLVSLVSAGMGVPSALSYQFFKNQDWVWGLGLIISGLFFAVLIIAIGAEEFRKLVLPNRDYHLRLPQWSFHLIRFGIPGMAAVLLFWWLYRSVGWDPQGWYNPLRAESMGTCLLQWLLAIGGLFFLNGWISKRFSREKKQNEH